MSRKKRRSFKIAEALEFLEATTVQNYPDAGTGIATDDDRPPGNIIYGEKYKRTSYFNKLTSYQDSWDVDDGDWTWDEFKNCGGMEDERNYSNTVKSMKDLFPKETWDNIQKRFKPVSQKDATQGFIDAGQPWRKGKEDQTGSDKNTHVKINTKERGSKFKSIDIKEKIDLLTK